MNENNLDTKIRDSYSKVLTKSGADEKLLQAIANKPTIMRTSTWLREQLASTLGVSSNMPQTNALSFV